MRAIERVTHLDAPRLLTRRRADRADAARTRGDERGRHAARAQNLRRPVDCIAFRDAAQIKLDSFPVEANRVGSLIEGDMLETYPRHHGFELTRLGHLPLVVEESPRLHQRPNGDVKGAARGSTGF